MGHTWIPFWVHLWVFVWTNHTKDHNRSRKLCFHHPEHVPVIRGNPDLHFEGAGNGPVVITWIGRVHELYSGTSPISLVEHCVTFRHDRRLLSLLGFVHNWPTSRWSAKKKKKKKKRKPVFIKRKLNHVVFSRATILSFHPVCICLTPSPQTGCVTKLFFREVQLVWIPSFSSLAALLFILC